MEPGTTPSRSFPVAVVLLVDERPEEVTEMQRSVKGEVIGVDESRAMIDRARMKAAATHRQARFEGSFRQRRGRVLARLREGPVPTRELDGEALASLLDDGLAEVTRGRAHLPRSPGSSPGGRARRR